MVVISENLISKLIEEVAPKVERLTGWKTHLDSLKVKLVRRDQVCELGVMPKYYFLGINTIPQTEKGRAALTSIRLFASYMAVGLYEPITETILIMPDNFGCQTNESGLVCKLGHELAHRCQFVNNPKFKDLYLDLIKKNGWIKCIRRK